MKIVSEKILHEGRFIRLIEENGWEYIQRHTCTGIVSIAAFTDDREAIFVAQFRPPSKKRVIEFPAGLMNDEAVDKEESIFEAAQRELLEETGYQAGRIVKLFAGPVSSGSSADIATLVRAFDVKKIAEGGGVEDEDIIVHTVSLSDIPQWLKTKEQEGCLIEPKVYTGLYFLTQSTA